VLAALVVLPGTAFAGGYGVAGVKDDRVELGAPETAMIWCPKLRTEVPIRLQQQMDCSEGVAVGTAKPAVARERFGGGLFGLPPHVPGGKTTLQDRDTPRPTPTTEPKGSDEPTPDENDETPPTSGQPKPKWDRLADFGVNGDNFFEQSEEFLSAVDAFREANGGYGGDWSGFNPPSGSTNP
jgi:hypothetical protein